LNTLDTVAPVNFLSKTPEMCFYSNTIYLILAIFTQQPTLARQLAEPYKILLDGRFGLGKHDRSFWQS